MANILFAWELGGGAGHVHLIGPLAKALRERGHKVFVAAKDLPAANALLNKDGIELLAAPYWSGRVGGLPPSASYPEVLLRVGYLEAAVLEALMKGWRSLFRLTQCDVVVAEHAPTALLAAAVDERPRVIMGTGFSVPPPVSPMPSVEVWKATPAPRLAQAEALVLQNVNRALHAFSRPPLETAAALLGAHDSLLCTAAELDHYQTVRGAAEYLGPLGIEGQFPAPEWPAHKGPKIFAYMHAGYEQFRWVAQALAATSYPSLFVAGGARAKAIRELSTDSLRLQASPVDIGAAAREASVVVSHSPHGTLWSVLQCGTPQLLIPAYVEQAALGINLARYGGAVLLGSKENPAQFKTAISRLIGESSFRNAAQALAGKYRNFDKIAQMEQLIGRVEAVAADSA